MGVLPGYRKRRDYFKTNSCSFDHSCGHISKKPKLSVHVNRNTPPINRASSKSAVSIIEQYPDRPFSREVHAPVRNSRYESYVSAKNTVTTDSYRGTPAVGASSGILMYEIIKDAALGTLRYFFPGRQKEKEKEVIVLDSEDEGREGVSNDSRLDELDNVGKWKEGKGTVENLQGKELRSLDSSLVSDVNNAIEKNGDMERTDYYGAPAYLRLFDCSKKRDDKLANIKFDIEIQERRIRKFLLWRPLKVEESIKNVAEECFVPLTDEEKEEISHAFSNPNRRKLLIARANSCIDITGEKLQCLKPGAWLNDEVINLYFELLKERESREPEKFLRCHFFNTFFYKKLISGRGGYNFQSVRRWTSQKYLGYSLLECDKIFVPIHKEVHWCLAVINKKEEKFQYLDSLGGSDNQVLNVLAKYFADEMKDKCGEVIDVSSWDNEFVTELPKQLNGFDCGVFMIKYADFYSRDIGLCFRQDDMPYFRLRTAKEILNLRAE